MYETSQGSLKPSHPCFSPLCYYYVEIYFLLSLLSRVLKVESWTVIFINQIHLLQQSLNDNENSEDWEEKVVDIWDYIPIKQSEEVPRVMWASQFEKKKIDEVLTRRKREKLTVVYYSTAGRVQLSFGIRRSCGSSIRFQYNLGSIELENNIQSFQIQSNELERQQLMRGKFAWGRLQWFWLGWFRLLRGVYRNHGECSKHIIICVIR